MPLVSGNSRSAISSNISELTHHGSRPRSHAQIVAIALSTADRSKRADGGPAGVPPDDNSTRMYDTSRFWTGPRPYVDPRSQKEREQDYEKKRDGDDALARKWLGQLPHADGGSAIDAALRIARAGGGYTPPAAPYFEREETREANQTPYGFALGTGLGRHDKNEVSVAPSSYVLPSDIVAGLGDGNSLAGAAVWDKILSTMPFGIAAPRSTGHRGPPPFNL